MKEHERPLTDPETGLVYTGPRYEYPEHDVVKTEAERLNRIYDWCENPERFKVDVADLVRRWRPTKLLDGLEPGSHEEVMTAVLLENQRTIQEC